MPPLQKHLTTTLFASGQSHFQLANEIFSFVSFAGSLTEVLVFPLSVIMTVRSICHDFIQGVLDFLKLK